MFIITKGSNLDHVCLSDLQRETVIHHTIRNLCFTNSFDVREQPERSWGVERGGKFTGMVGELQGEKVDVGAPMGPLAERLNAMDFVNVYKVDFMKILSLKPTLLPEYLSLIRPFSGRTGYLLLPLGLGNI